MNSIKNNEVEQSPIVFVEQRITLRRQVTHYDEKLERLNRIAAGVAAATERMGQTKTYFLRQQAQIEPATGR